MNEPMLNEAKRIAGQSVTDRVDGKQAEEAKDVILHLLEAAGLDYTDGLRLVGAVQWERWNAGFQSARITYWNPGT